METSTFLCSIAYLLIQFYFFNLSSICSSVWCHKDKHKHKEYVPAHLLFLMWNDSDESWLNYKSCVFIHQKHCFDNWCSAMGWSSSLCLQYLELCVCTVVSSGCSQYSQKWWGRVRLLLGVMRLPAAPHCLTKSPSVSLPSRLVFAQHHTLPLNHMCANNLYIHMYDLPLPPS